MPPVDLVGPIEEIGHAIDRLNVLYEQYFVGVERQPPNVARQEVDKKFAWLSVQNIGNTAIRFRYHTLLRRWKTYLERWDKVQREIENGTYRPHKLRAERRIRERDEERARAKASAGSSPSAPQRQPPPIPRSEIPGMSEVELRTLHQRYLEACRSVGDAREVRYEALVASLTKQVPDILKQNKCDELGFAVVLKGDKVVLKATPRRRAD